MKKRLNLIWILAAVAFVILVRQLSPSSNDRTLNLVTWSQYFPKAFLDKFTADTGVAVRVHLISSNEELFAKLKAGATGYDVMQPSDYMVERLAKAGLLAPIEKGQLRYLDRLTAALKTVPYDNGLVFSLPFLEGSTGLIVNTRRIPVPLDGISWGALFESKDPRNTYLMDDMREVFAAALLWKGRNPNNLDKEAVTTARDILRAARDNVSAFNSEPVGLVQRDDITIAHAFSYQGAEATRLRPHLKYILPKEGAIQWIDTMVVSAGSKRKVEAHTFLNYVMNPANATALQKLNGFANPYANPELKRESAFAPGPPADRRFFLRHIPDEPLQRVSIAWTELKAG